MSEIRRVGGTPLGGGQPVRIVGAQPITDGPTEIRDSRIHGEPTRVEVVHHEEVVVEGDRLRASRRSPSDPQIRVRQNTGSFERAINDDD